MSASFPFTQARCYQEAARLMNRGVSLSIALRGCMRDRGSGGSVTTNQTLGTHASARDSSGSALGMPHPESHARTDIATPGPVDAV